MTKQRLAIVFFGLFWSAITLLFDGLLGYGLVNQLRSQGFSQVTGYITHSEITTHDSDDGVTHGVDIRYHYEVNGSAFEGNRFRYGEGTSSDSGWAHRAVNKYHEGAEVPVYYNARNPSESVLVPGVDGSNLMMLLFMTPFNAVMLGIWIVGLGMLRDKFSSSPNGGVRFYQDQHSLRVRLPRYPAVAVLLAVAGLFGFLATFPIAFLFGGFHPRLPVVGTALVIAYGSGLAAFLWQLWANHSGKSDLVIDHNQQTVALPKTFGRKTKIQIAVSDIKKLFVETVAQKGREGGTTYTYVPTLLWQNSNPAQGKLAEFYTQAKAERFVDWLRPQLKISAASEESITWKSSMPVQKEAS